MIPLSGFLGRVMSTRMLFTVAATSFTATSFLCAMSSLISEMIIWRTFQEFLGGAMILAVFASAFTIFPASKRNLVSPLVGFVATLAPTVWPTLGGYLSHVLSRHWLFLINVAPGIAVLIAFALIGFDRHNWKLFDKFDWWDLLAPAVFWAGWIMCWRKDPRTTGSPTSLWGDRALVAAAGGALTLWGAFTREEPIVHLSAFGNTNVAVGSLFSFVMEIGFYGLTTSTRSTSPRSVVTTAI